jgi:hypothetical protein
MAAERIGIADGHPNPLFARGVGNIVEIAVRVRLLVIDGGRNRAALYRQEASRGFYSAGRN